jgi:hypothetical protein
MVLKNIGIYLEEMSVLIFKPLSSLIQRLRLEFTMKSHHHHLYQASCMAFSASFWLLFGVLLWRMDFSAMDLVHFGQAVADSTSLNGVEEVRQSGFLP